MREVDRGRTVPPLDENAAAVLAVEIVGTVERGHAARRGPTFRVSEHGRERVVVFDTFDKSIHALRVTLVPCPSLLLGEAESPGGAAVLPGDEEFGHAVLEENPARRIGCLDAVGEQGRNPERVVFVDAPRESQEDAFFAPAADGENLDAGHINASRRISFSHRGCTCRIPQPARRRRTAVSNSRWRFRSPRPIAGARPLRREK